MMNVIASQTSCEGKVCGSKGGNAPLCPSDGCSVCAVVVAIARSACGGSVPPGLLEGEQQQERDQQREDAERLSHGEPEDQVRELALRGRRIAHRGREIVSEDRAHADAGAAHADAGNARADVLCCYWIHEKNSLSRCRGGRSVARVNRIVEIDASENGEHISLQRRDQRLQRGERYSQAERQHRTDPAKDAPG